MKRSFTKQIKIYTLLLSLLGRFQVCQAQNIIQNYSCDFPLINNEIPFWQEINGTEWTQRLTDPTPYTGLAYFFPGTTSNAKLKQEIDISSYRCWIDLGIQDFQFSAYVRVYQQSPPDESNIEIQFFNLSSTLLQSFDFGPYNQSTIWQRIDSLIRVPVSSRKVVIILHSVRHNGSNNDGYYDELSLMPLPIANNPYEGHLNVSICDGQSYLGHNTTGIFYDTLIAINGCDSIRILNLNVKTKSFSTINQTICEGQAYLGYSTSGAFSDTLLGTNGCDSIRTLNLIVIPRSFTTIKHSICLGQSYLGYTSSGIFTDTLLNTNGCDSIRTLILTVLETPKPDLGSDKEICIGDSVRLSPGIFTSYLWQNNSILDHFVASSSGIYSVTVNNICGSKSDEIVVSQKLCNESFPNTFTPNNDGLNDLFKILNAFNLGDYKLIIYTRWGQKIFETNNYERGWDGKIKGHLQTSGAYTYFCEYKKNGITRHQKGTLILLR